MDVISLHRVMHQPKARPQSAGPKLLQQQVPHTLRPKRWQSTLQFQSYMHRKPRLEFFTSSMRQTPRSLGLPPAAFANSTPRTKRELHLFPSTLHNSFPPKQARTTSNQPFPNTPSPKRTGSNSTNKRSQSQQCAHAPSPQTSRTTATFATKHSVKPQAPLC